MARCSSRSQEFFLFSPPAFGLKSQRHRSGRNWQTKRNVEVFSATDFLAAASRRRHPCRQCSVAVRLAPSMALGSQVKCGRCCWRGGCSAGNRPPLHLLLRPPLNSALKIKVPNALPICLVFVFSGGVQLSKNHSVGPIIQYLPLIVRKIQRRQVMADCRNE